MSRIKEIKYELGATVKTGNFENIKPTISMTAELQPSENQKDEMDKLKKTVESTLKEEIKRLKKGIK